MMMTGDDVWICMDLYGMYGMYGIYDRPDNKKKPRKKQRTGKGDRDRRIGGREMGGYRILACFSQGVVGVGMSGFLTVLCVYCSVVVLSVVCTYDERGG